MKKINALKQALLKEFGHQAGELEKNIAGKFPKRKEDSVHIGMKDYNPHREEQEYCVECGVPAMYEGECQSCGYKKDSMNLSDMFEAIKRKRKKKFKNSYTKNK